MKFTVMQYESEHQVCIIVALYGRAEQTFKYICSGGTSSGIFY